MYAYSERNDNDTVNKCSTTLDLVFAVLCSMRDVYKDYTTLGNVNKQLHPQQQQLAR
jgi:hypothetical protein